MAYYASCRKQGNPWSSRISAPVGFHIVRHGKVAPLGTCFSASLSTQHMLSLREFCALFGSRYGGMRSQANQSGELQKTPAKTLDKPPEMCDTTAIDDKQAKNSGIHTNVTHACQDWSSASFGQYFDNWRVESRTATGRFPIARWRPRLVQTTRHQFLSIRFRSSKDRDHD